MFTSFAIATCDTQRPLLPALELKPRTDSRAKLERAESYQLNQR